MTEEKLSNQFDNILRHPVLSLLLRTFDKMENPDRQALVKAVQEMDSEKLREFSRLILPERKELFPHEEKTEGFDPNLVASQYLTDALSPGGLAKIVDRVVEILEPMDFDAIAFSGASGTLVAPLVAVRMSKGMLLVRKITECCQSQCSVEGAMSVKSYVILDDFIMDGNTIDHIKSVVEVWTKAKLKGIVLYSHLTQKGNYDGTPFISVNPPANRDSKGELAPWRKR